MGDDCEFRELIRNAKGGDRKSFTKLLMGFDDELRNYIASRVARTDGHAISVDDLFQESLMDAFRGIDGFTSDTASGFRAWLHAIADNRFVSTIRVIRSQKRGGNFQLQAIPDEFDSTSRILENLFQDSDQAPSEKVERSETIEAIHLNLANLPDDQQRAIRARYIDGLSLEETAQSMNRSCGAVRGLLHRAKLSLKLAMGGTSKWFQ